MLAQAALLKVEIEAKLAQRIPSALSPRVQPVSRLQPVHNEKLNTLLGGGLPLGSVCEFSGPDGSGRSSMALSLLASACGEAACAYIDASNALSPHSAAAAGVDLANLLWVRFAPDAADEGRTTKPASNQPSLSLPCSGDAERFVQHNRGGVHPRQETRNLAPALEQMLLHKQERRQQKMEGTPGYPNQPLGLEKASQDQIEWERFNLRRVDESDPLRRSDKQAAKTARKRAAATQVRSFPRSEGQKPWDCLDRAIRAADQVLQSGGFRVVVLDLASIAPEQALRIPAATWFRFRKTSQESDALLLLLTKEPCAGSSAACVVKCSPGESPTVRGVLSATTHTFEMVRQRTEPVWGRKGPHHVAGWNAVPAWMRAVGR